MEILEGKKKLSIDALPTAYTDGQRVLIDIGTGDGRFAYHYALEHPDAFAIGIDPVKDAMVSYSIKKNRKASKGGVKNLIYVIGALENLPHELKDSATMITVNLPWGSLLEAIVKGEVDKLKAISALGKDGCKFRTIFTYSHLHELGEMSKRQLPDLSEDYLSSLIPLYKEGGIEIEAIEELEGEALNNLKTLWAKKLFVSKKRSLFSISGQIVK